MSGDFRIGAKLGRGPVGATYLAQRPDGAQVVVKVVSSRFHEQPKLLADVLDDARAWTGFSHANAAATLEVTTHEGRQVIVMEHVPGITLERHLAEVGPLDARAAVRVVRDLAQALAEAHALGLAHGDIRPAKVHLDQGRGILIDLGLARGACVAAGLGRFGLHTGHPDYLAPELMGQPSPTAAGDVYALGLLLHAMLVGAPPFRGDVETVLRAQREEALPPAPALQQSPSLARFLGRLVAKSPRERYADAQGVLGGLYELVGQAPPTAPRLDSGQWRRAAVEHAAAIPPATPWQAAPVAPDLSAGERTSTVLTFNRPTAPPGSGMDTAVPASGRVAPPPAPASPPPLPPRPVAPVSGAFARPPSGASASAPATPTPLPPATPTPMPPATASPAAAAAAITGGFARPPAATTGSTGAFARPPAAAGSTTPGSTTPGAPPKGPAPAAAAASKPSDVSSPAIALGMTLDDSSVQPDGQKKPVAVKLGKKIGEGPVGSSYEGELKDHPGGVVVKIVSQRFSKYPEILARILDTVRKAEGFVDPRIVAVLRVVHIGGRDAVISELAPGTTLREVLRTRGALPSDEVLDIMRDVALALQVARGRELSHGDVRPEKLYLAPGSPARLADFGLAEASGLGAGFGQYGAPWGHPGYLAPEVVADPKRVPDFATDVYALGVMAYELTCARRPFEGATPKDVLRQHLEAPLPPPPAEANVPGPVAELILRLTSKDPKRRADAPGDLIAQIDRCKRQAQRTTTAALAAPPVEEFDPLADGEKGEGWIKQELPKPRAKQSQRLKKPPAGAPQMPPPELYRSEDLAP